MTTLDDCDYDEPDDGYEPDDEGADLNLGSCPYYARYKQLPGFDPAAICGGGCVDEPTCITMEPAGGWQAEGSRP